MDRRRRWGAPPGTVAVVALALMAAGCAAQGSWRAEPPLPAGSVAPSQPVTHLSCGGPTTCLALPGNPPTPNDRTGWGQVWDGASWRAIRSPGMIAYALDCVGAWCLAVGKSDVLGPTSSWTWDGAAWSTPTPFPAGYAGALDCTGPGFCLAIGSDGSSSPILRWNGTSWAVVPGRTSTASPSSLACPAAGTCILRSVDPNDLGASFERWQGGVWSAMPVAGGIRRAFDLACAGTTVASCVAVAEALQPDGSDRMAFLRMSTSGWVPDPFPLDRDVERLACATDGTCLATDGSRALVLDAANVAVVAGSTLPLRTELACASRTACVVTGQADAARATFDHWDGTTWTRRTGGSGTTMTDARLTSVSCVASRRCVAVGTRAQDDRRLPLVEVWDGGTWRFGPGADGLVAPTDASVDLRTVACSALDRCLVVGNRVGPGSSTLPLFGRLVGASWSDELSALPGPPPTLLTDVSCHETFCAVAGVVGSTPTVYVSSGGPWRAIATPPFAFGVPSPGRTLLQLDCASSTWCVATANQATSTITGLVATWDGTAWSTPTSTPSFLGGAACSAPQRCYVTGATVGSPPGGTIGTWSGGAWTFQTTAQPLSAVSCSTDDTCVAVAGFPGSAFPAALSGAVARQGGTWKTMGATPAFPSDGALEDVSCVAGVCLTVGGAGRDPAAWSWMP